MSGELSAQKMTLPVNLDLAVQSELIDLLYKQAKPGIVGTVIVSSSVTFALFNQVSNTLLLSWYCVMMVVSVLRYLFVKAYFSRMHNPQPLYWYRVFLFITVLGSLTWAFAGIMLVPENGVYQTLLACALAGVSGAAVPFFAASRLACAVYIIPMLLPFAMVLLLQNDLPHHLLGMFTLLYFLLLFFSSLRTHAAISNALKLKFQNLELIGNLSSAKKEMEEINQELHKEMADRLTAEKLLRESEEQYRLVTDALPVLISYIDTSLTYRYNNKAHENWMGESLANITGKAVKDVLSSAAYSIFIDQYEKLTLLKTIHYETVMQFRDDEERYVSVTLIPHIKDDQIQGVFSLTSDVTPRINYLATHDALTDLPNRSLFTARFSQALKKAQKHHCQVALLFLDLDHFKNINDSLGHDVGDQLLIKVAESVKSCLRVGDMLARQGGDEFTILLDDVSSCHVIEIAKRITEICRLPFNINGKEIFITTSIGISIYPEDGKDMQILLKNADMAIYRAKEKGRNTFEFYTEELNLKMIKKHTIETQLRTAIEKDELLLHYQPIIDTQTSQFCGVESLIRWQHPELGMVSPNDFIPIAEEVGLIIPIGATVIRKACLQKLAWDQQGILPLYSRISINISARQFKEDHLITMIKEVLAEIGVSAECITFELTESLLMHDIDHSITILKSLKELGIGISIDDFGTGYSSFNYLRKFPLDIIKIDRSFINDVTIKKDDAAIVTAIIAMAHSLKMKVVAEGVETIAQYDFLREQQCDAVQGFLISKPLSPLNLMDFLTKTYSMETFLQEQRQITHAAIN